MANREIRVLICDDEDDIRQLYSTLLTLTPDLTVCGLAGNGREAIQQAEATQPDVVLLDVRMPVMDGIRAMPLIREVCEAKVVFLTALDPQIIEDLNGDLHPDAILPKAVLPSVLYETIRGVAR